MRTSRALLIFVLVTGMCCLVAGCVRVVRETPTSSVGHIPSKSTVRTEKDVADEIVAMFHRHLVEAYESVGDRSPAWDSQARDLLKGLCEYAPGIGGPSRDHLLAETRAVLEAGCEDPLIVYFRGALLEEAGEQAEAEGMMRRGLEGLVASDYPRFPTSDAAFRLAELCRDLHGEDAEESGRCRELGIRLLGESWSDGSIRADESGVFLQYIDALWGELDQGAHEGIYQTLSSNEDVDPYVVKVVGGRYHIDAAWEARGGSWAREVTEEGWRGFAEHLDKARLLLTEAWELRPDLPHAPTYMIRVAMGGHGGPGETPKLWFYRATEAQMDYPDAYRRVLYALLPRWGGSYEEIYELGLECLHTNRFNTDVPLFYAWVLHEIVEDSDGDRSWWQRPEVYENLERMFQGYAEASQDHDELVRYESIHAATDFLTGHYEEAGRRLEALGDGLNGPAFERYAGPLPVARRQIGRHSVISARESR